MTDEYFDKRVGETIKQKIKPHLCIDDQLDQIWAEIMNREYIFDRDERSAEMLKGITRGEIQSFVHNLFVRNVRKLSIQVTTSRKEA